MKPTTNVIGLHYLEELRARLAKSYPYDSFDISIGIDFEDEYVFRIVRHDGRKANRAWEFFLTDVPTVEHLHSYIKSHVWDDWEE